jgi:hypothetical protein
MFLWKYLANWNILGEMFLENRTSRFLNFSKSARSYTSFNFGTENNNKRIYIGSLVRGQYAKSSFTGIEAIKVLIN